MRNFLIIGIFVLTGCSSSNNTVEGSTASESPINNSWILVSYGSQTEERVLAVEDIPFSFIYNRDDQSHIAGFSGFDGCNVFSSQGIMLEGNNIMPVNGVNVDAAFCSNLQYAEYLQQFDFFYSVISSTFQSVEGNSMLSLTSMNGDTLSFEPCVLADPASLDSACEAI